MSSKAEMGLIAGAAALILLCSFNRSNCFFRSLGDQLVGDEGLHASLRAKVIAHMRENEEVGTKCKEDSQDRKA